MQLLSGDRQTIMWTLIGDKPVEALGIIGDITRACKFTARKTRRSSATTNINETLSILRLQIGLLLV
jgi:hypothetical protein